MEIMALMKTDQRAWVLEAIAHVIRMMPGDLIPLCTPTRHRRSSHTPRRHWQQDRAEKHIVVEVAIALQPGILEIEGHAHHFRPPGVAVIPPGLLHRESAINMQRPSSTLWFNGGNEVLMGLVSRYRPGQDWDLPWKKLLAGPLVHRFLLPLETSDAVIALREDKTSFEVFRAHLLSVLAELHRLFVVSHTDAEGTLNEATFDHLRLFLRGNLHRPITLSDAAQLTHLSPRYLNRLFRKQYGEPIHEYLNRLRMEKALALLDSTNMRIKEIAEKVGFTDPLYFSRCFHQRFGHAPSDVPRNLKGSQPPA